MKIFLKNEYNYHRYTMTYLANHSKLDINIIQLHIIILISLKLIINT